jgi:hypothetical protein
VHFGNVTQLIETRRYRPRYTRLIAWKIAGIGPLMVPFSRNETTTKFIARAETVRLGREATQERLDILDISKRNAKRMALIAPLFCLRTIGASTSTVWLPTRKDQRGREDVRTAIFLGLIKVGVAIADIENDPQYRPFSYLRSGRRILNVDSQEYSPFEPHRSHRQQCT